MGHPWTNELPPSLFEADDSVGTVLGRMLGLYLVCPGGAPLSAHPPVGKLLPFHLPGLWECFKSCMGVLHISKGPLPLAKLAFFGHFRFLTIGEYRQPNNGCIRKHSCGVSQELIPRGNTAGAVAQSTRMRLLSSILVGLPSGPNVRRPTGADCSGRSARTSGVCPFRPRLRTCRRVCCR